MKNMLQEKNPYNNHHDDNECQQPWWWWMSPSIVTMITLIATTMMTNTSNNHCNKSWNRQCRGDIWSWGSKRKGDGKGVRGEKWETKLGVIESNGWKRKKNV